MDTLLASFALDRGSGPWVGCVAKSYDSQRQDLGWNLEELGQARKILSSLKASGQALLDGAQQNQHQAATPVYKPVDRKSVV